MVGEECLDGTNNSNLVATRELALGLGTAMEFIVVKNNKATSMLRGRETRFYHEVTPTVTIDEYVERLVDLSSVSYECFVVATSYVVRLERFVTGLTAHRLLLAGVVVAAKMQDDLLTEGMAEMSRIGGVDVDELVVLEAELLRLLKFKMCVDRLQYEWALSVLKTSLSLREVFHLTSPPATAHHHHHHHHQSFCFQVTDDDKENVPTGETSPKQRWERPKEGSYDTTHTNIAFLPLSPVSTNRTTSTLDEDDHHHHCHDSPITSPLLWNNNNNQNNNDNNNNNKASLDEHCPSDASPPSVFAMRRSKGLSAAEPNQQLRAAEPNQQLLAASRCPE